MTIRPEIARFILNPNPTYADKETTLLAHPQWARVADSDEGRAVYYGSAVCALIQGNRDLGAIRMAARLAFRFAARVQQENER